MRAIAAVSMLAAGLLAVGCASVDPTDPSHFTDALVLNDTTAPVVIVQCDTSCHVLHDRTSVAAGDSATVNVSNEGIRVGYLVYRESGKPIGCIYEKFNGVHSTPTMRVSTAQKCF